MTDTGGVSPRARASVLGMAFVALADRVPMFRHRLWRWWYDALARHDGPGELLLMNFGYAPADGQEIALDPAEEPYRYPLQLYRHVASRLDLGGKDVLEIGCGRGGGTAYLARWLGPRSVLGVDLSAQAVVRSRATHRVPGLVFEVGAAERLPCADASADVIINVESSHCYADMARFAAEVTRVLRPGGHMAFCDLRTPPALEHLHSLFAAAGLEALHEETMNTEVVRALDAVGGQRETAIAVQVPRGLRRVMRDFTGMPGTVLYNMLRDGRLRYLHLLLQKPPAKRDRPDCAP
jgi:SAM-dependent methyltransferase